MGRSKKRITKTMVCTKCGKEKPRQNFYYHRQRKHYMSSCIECNSKQCRNYQNRVKSTAEGVLTLRTGQIYRTARIKNLPYDLSLGKHLRDLWRAQNGRCAYTGRPMTINGYQEKDPNALTIDRITPAKGYVVGNIALACSLANRAKQDMTSQEFLSFCNEVLTHKTATQTGRPGRN